MFKWLSAVFRIAATNTLLDCGNVDSCLGMLGFKS